MLYNNLSGYLKTKYGARLKKICIDGGFGCPNRDGKCGTGGCIYCGERGAGEHIDPCLSITEQVNRALANSGAGDLFIAYFQNFTNTYAPISALKERYDAALISDKIKILAIGTRPDCIDEDVARLIASYRDKVDVWVELGLQSSSNVTAKVINRGYTTDVYLRAVEILHSFNIPVVTHIIIGLPGEGEAEVVDTVKTVNSVRSWGVKIHSIYVMEGTELANMYRRGEYAPPTLDEYVRLATMAIGMLNKDIIVHRITGDCPRDMLIAPDWNADKNGIISLIQSSLKSQGIKQGSKNAQ